MQIELETPSEYLPALQRVHSVLVEYVPGPQLTQSSTSLLSPPDRTALPGRQMEQNLLPSELYLPSEQTSQLLSLSFEFLLQGVQMLFSNVALPTYN